MQSCSKRLRAALGCAFTAACATPAPAETNGPTLPSIAYEEVVVEDRRDMPAATSRLSAEEIETLRPYTLHDAFDFMPGVRTIDDDALGRRAGISVRGAPGRRSR